MDSPSAPERYVDPVIEVYKKDVDRTLIRALLKLTPTERLQRLQDMMHLHAEFERARTKKP
ncbi:MAG: hypothetical protein JNL98_35515 [Bryobacterales bacterium]|nr:hypothetical protein [Bryobacterales bacterium]